MTPKQSSHPTSTSKTRDGYVSFGHPSVPLRLKSGESVDVDRGILELVTLINEVPGIETKGSCQGEDSTYGYVQFMPDDTEGKAHASLYFLYHMLRTMHTAWVNHRQEMAVHEALSGTEHPHAYEFKFTTELGNGYVLKWNPHIYPALLAAAQQAAEDTRRDT